jgi:hypothetical protein
MKPRWSKSLLVADNFLTDLFNNVAETDIDFPSSARSIARQQTPASLPDCALI